MISGSHQRVLITGASGFIGEHLCEALTTQGISHGAIDRTPATSDPHPLRMVHTGNLLDEKFLREVIQGYDVIVHLAGRTGQGQLDDPADFVRKNVETTASVFRCARETTVKRVVVSSSYEVYGTPRYLPIDEVHPMAPTSVYGATMAAREALAVNLGKQYSLNTVILRFFTVYGSPVNERNRKGAIATFVKSVTEQATLSLTGSLDSMRDYIFIKDIIRCLVACIVHPSLGNTTLNVGTGVGSSLKTIVATLKSHFPNLRYGHEEGNSAAGSFDVVAETSRIGKELGFVCLNDLNKGISEMLSSQSRR